MVISVFFYYIGTDCHWLQDFEFGLVFDLLNCYDIWNAELLLERRQSGAICLLLTADTLMGLCVFRL